ncbi:PREDICTED: uncharacterized protein C9orf9 homolog [Sturnus vulgaris]|uniref:uncharacterized protein C9orf9 homolog n=1 Tax=Sturnus vulgaris TaxID=9172 RepID=UPI00071A7636|nr:PREDICTED: uncharacterized protein C9orf9 homolog [Sturnus vulgaris]
MDEVVETLRKIEQDYKLFQQQQFTFIRALEHTREEAHDLIKPVSSIVQVQCYKDHHCYNSTDRRILNMFISICNDLRNLCQKLEKVHPGDSVTKGLVEKCKVLLNDSNDFTALRVQCYKDHHCYNSTDRRILNMFISICNDLRNLCQKLEKVHPGDSVTKGLVEKCKVLLNDSNDFTALRAT